MVVATRPTPSTSASLAGQAADAARRIPFTLVVVAVMLVAGVATGSLWRSLRESGLMDRVG